MEQLRQNINLITNPSDKNLGTAAMGTKEYSHPILI
jgi:hypothetical protein